MSDYCECKRCACCGKLERPAMAQPLPDPWAGYAHPIWIAPQPTTWPRLWWTYGPTVTSGATAFEFTPVASGATTSYFVYDEETGIATEVPLAEPTTASRSEA